MSGKVGIVNQKRIQNIVFLLIHAGADLNIKYTLCDYGVYSNDLADLCDDMVSNCFLKAEPVDSTLGTNIRYKLSLLGKKCLEKSNERILDKYETLIKDLISKHICHLDLASSILFFFLKTENWGESFKTACNNKNILKTDMYAQDALELAKFIYSYPDLSL